MILEGVVTTVAGTGQPGNGAALNRPHGAAVGPDGAVLIGDTLNNQIRQVR